MKNGEEHAMNHWTDWLLCEPNPIKSLTKVRASFVVFASPPLPPRHLCFCICLRTISCAPYVKTLKRTYERTIERTQERRKKWQLHMADISLSLSDTASGRKLGHFPLRLLHFIIVKIKYWKKKFPTRTIDDAVLIDSK